MQDQDRNFISIGRWMLMMLGVSIPLVNIIILIVWAVDHGNETRRNFAIAVFLWWAIGIAVTLLLFVIFGAAFAGLAGTGSQ